MDNFNEQFLFSISIIALGYILKRFDIIREREGEGMTRIVLNVTLPCLIIVSFSDMVIQPSLLFLSLVAVIYGVFIALVGLFVFRGNQRQTKGMMTMVLPGFNIGLFAFPLVEGIWGTEGLKYFGMFDVGNSLVVFGVSYIIATYFAAGDVKPDYRQVGKKISKSIPLLTYVGVMMLTLFNLRLPEYVLDVSGIISQANMPLSLLVLGIYLNFQFDKSNLKLVGKYLAYRYGIGLAVGLGFFWLLPMGEMVRYTLLVGLLLPITTTTLAYSVEFGYNTRLIGTLSNMTMIISFILLWIVANLVV